MKTELLFKGKKVSAEQIIKKLAKIRKDRIRKSIASNCIK